MKTNLLYIIFFGFVFQSQAQYTYLVYFKDKTNIESYYANPISYLSQKSIERRKKQKIAIRFADLPVNTKYLDSLKKLGAEVWYNSRWFNAAYVKCDTNLFKNTISTLGFVTKFDVLYTKTASSLRVENFRKEKKSERVSISSSDYGNAASQVSMICADEMHKQGFHGEGMTIAVTDGGFTNANNVYFFDSLFVNNQIKGTFDFVRKDKDVYSYSSHGTNVLSCIGGYAKGQLIGTAYKSDFYLFRTEDDATEYPIEEANWLMAAEKADSLGVDIINVSLGYNTFDNTNLNHKLEESDGKSTIITRAADFAAGAGMIVVVSAGNSGNSASWNKITFPADADSVLTVGAVTSVGNVSGFSGYGPTADGRIKPDVAAQGVDCVIGAPSNVIVRGNGTSFSAPIMTGLVAGLWQANTSLTNMEIIDFIRKAGSIYANPDNRMGYGIPCFTRANTLAKGKKDLTFVTERYIYPNPLTAGKLNLVVNISDLGKTILVELFSVSGKRIFEQKIENINLTNELEIANDLLVAGLYFVRISGESFGTKNVKLIKN